MRLLIIIGAGASSDVFPRSEPYRYKLPLTNELFSTDEKQNELLQKHLLVGLAAKIRRKINIADVTQESSSVESILNVIREDAIKRDDQNDLESLFITRFYMHELITWLSQNVNNTLHSHTVYIDLLNQLKEWIYGDTLNRQVDIVSFNYDDLLEKAMENVYGHDWAIKNTFSSMSAYYSGTNLRIYKPHGSINWGRTIHSAGNKLTYREPRVLLSKFNEIEFNNEFTYMSPYDLSNSGLEKEHIPVIAVPFKGKTNFNECPVEMHHKMIEAVSSANIVITIGWKGADEHFVKLLKEKNNKNMSIIIISRRGTSELVNVFSPNRIRFIKSSVSNFVSKSNGFDSLLQGIT